MRRSIVFLVLLLCLSVTPLGQLRPQPVGELSSDQALRLVLRKLVSSGTFMQTTAHPDDEDNALLAWLAWGMGMRTVLVTATRGDGGQNEIGPELFQSLGVLRTEEILAAHRFDGAEQYFTRAVDFGYSFSVEESIRKWGHDEILGDFVRHIRTVRPDVIAGFVCGGAGGGQHHQASTQLTIEAFRAAADPARYPEQIAAGLRPWQASRVFCTGYPGTTASERPTSVGADDLIVSETARFDPVLGRTYGELGLEARSMHKCQGTSQLLLLPDERSFNRTYRLRASVIDERDRVPRTLFEAIDTALAGLTRFAGAHPPAPLSAGLKAIADSVAAATTALGSGGPSSAVPRLVSGLNAVRDLRRTLASIGLGEAARYEIDLRLQQKEAQFERAIAIASGTSVEALVDDGVATPGQSLGVSLIVGNTGTSDVTLKGARVSGLADTNASCAATIKAGGAYKCQASGTVPPNARTTGPYWTLRRDSARYDFEPDVPFGAPFRPSPFVASFDVSVGGVELRIDKVLEHRYDSVLAGEKRMEIAVVPAFSIRVIPDIVVVPASAARGSAGSNGSGTNARSRDVKVEVTNHHKGPAQGEVALDLPQGWRAVPPHEPVKFARENEQATLRFSVAPENGIYPGEYTVTAAVSGPDGRYDSGFEVVEYPHTHRRHVPAAATARVEVIDVSVAPDLRMGYIMGVGDEVPQALEQLGAHVEMITPDMLASGDLSQYNVIVTGVRAYERRADLRAHNDRLLQYASNGGTVLVQYNKVEFNEAQFAPYPAKVSSNRVTDENAPVEVLVPDHPVFNTPNRLGPETWANWVQERGLYFLGERDPRYVDLVRSADPFEYNRGPKTGALVEARVGKGRWIYIGLALWRQLPAGTPGAYRLMANLISLR